MSKIDVERLRIALDRYARAPEHPWPQAAEDIAAEYDSLGPDESDLPLDYALGVQDGEDAIIGIATSRIKALPVFDRGNGPDYGNEPNRYTVSRVAVLRVLEELRRG
jgi:hypothetical protein